MKSARCQAGGEIDGLPVIRQSVHPEQILEGHPSRHEYDIRRAEPDGSRGYRRYAERRAAREHRPPYSHREEIEPVDEQIDP